MTLQGFALDWRLQAGQYIITTPNDWQRAKEHLHNPLIAKSHFEILS